MKRTSSVVIAVMVVAVAACGGSKSPAKQRDDIAESRQNVIKITDELAVTLAAAGWEFNSARGYYDGCTVGLSDAGVQFSAALQLSPKDDVPSEQLAALTSELEDAGWDDVEPANDGNAVEAKRNSVWVQVQPAAPYDEPPDRQSMKISLQSTDCKPDPDGLDQQAEELPLSVPVEPREKPCCEPHEH